MNWNTQRGGLASVSTCLRPVGIFSCGLLLSTSLAYGAPVGGQVSGGSATIAQTGPLTSITQNTGRAIIDWQGFDIAAGESVAIAQPSTASILLNRIHDTQPSVINGSLTANGQVILMNPNGMLFGKGSRIDVAGLIATSANIANDDFMTGDVLSFGEAGNPGASIINEGSITIRDAGLAALVAPNVQNDGAIVAALGSVQLAGADTMTVDLYGDGLISFAADNSTATAVTQSGQVTASHILLQAADADHLLTSSVNLSGVTEATDMQIHDDGNVILGGDITATARDVTVSGTVIADGQQGGGNIRLGGDYQGSGDLATAERTTIVSDADISASATTDGDGGRIIVWADDTTRMDSHIAATASDNGDGGFIETSGKRILDLGGSADASAPNGAAGEWLLDPTDVTISGGAGNDVSAGGTFNGLTPIDATTINQALNGGTSVTITTTSGGGDMGDITLDNATISKTGGGNATLTLKSDRSIATTGTNSISSSSGKLNLVLWSDTNNDGVGSVDLGDTTISTNGGDVVAAGGLDNGANGGGNGDGRPDNFARSTDYGVDFVDSSITTNGGDVIFIGESNANITNKHGIRLLRSSISSGDGDITLHLVNAREGEVIYGTGNDEMDGVIIGAGLVHVRWNGDMAITQGTIALAADAEGNLHPTFGYWPRSARDGLRTLLKTGERKVRLVADRLGAITVPFPAADPDPFFNINTPEDLAHAERMIQR